MANDHTPEKISKNVSASFELDEDMKSSYVTEQVEILFRNLKLALISNILLPLLIIIALQDSIDLKILLSWYSAIVFVALARFTVYRLYNAHAGARDPQKWRTLYVIGSFAAGSLWAVSVGFIPFLDDPFDQVLVVFNIAGMTAGVLTSSSAYWRAIIAFNALPLLAIIIVMFHLGKIEMGIMLVFYSLFINRLAKNLEDVIRKSINLKHHNAKLAERALAEKNKVIEHEKQLQVQVEQLQKTQKELNTKNDAYRALAEENKKSRIEAEEASNAKSEFLASISHEIRTPMNGVLGMLSLMMDTDLSKKQTEYVKIARESSELLLQLLNDVLDLTKVESGKVELDPVDFDLENLFREVGILWNFKAKTKGLNFETDIAEGLSKAWIGDVVRIRQILHNLISNAIKFTEKGHIKVSAMMNQHGDKDSLLKFVVEDTGIGFSNDIKDKLFDKFTQADASTTRKFGGSGLGLSICRNLAELLGGEIDVHSEPGKGSSFWFTVRLAPQEENQIEEDQNIDSEEVLSDRSTNEQTADQQIQILVVEDNEINRAVLKGMLMHSRLVLTEAFDGEQALEILEKRTFDLVLMDIQMPKLDGIEATKRIRALKDQQKASVPIIALTANAMEGDRANYLQAGMNEHISKPIDVQKLYTILSEFVGELRPEYGETDTPEKTNSVENTEEHASLEKFMQSLD